MLGIYCYMNSITHCKESSSFSSPALILLSTHTFTNYSHQHKLNLTYKYTHQHKLNLTYKYTHQHKLNLTYKYTHQHKLNLTYKYTHQHKLNLTYKYTHQHKLYLTHKTNYISTYTLHSPAQINTLYSPA